ncbi:tetratricopeptide repeat protein [Elusimicrobiota bacterium]
MKDFLLFLVFVVLPFFRVFNAGLLQNIHNIIAVAGIGVVIMGVLANKLDEYIDQFLHYVVPILLSTIAIHFFLKTYDSAQIKITLLEIGGPLVLILWLIKRVYIGSFKLDKSRQYVLFPAIFFLLTGVVSFMLSPFKLETFEPGLLRRVSYLGIFIVAIYEFNREEDFSRILNWMLVTCFFVVTYGVIQYLGLDWHIWKGAFGQRVFSTFGNPNFFAAWIVLILPLVFAKILITRQWYYVVLALGIFFNIYITGTKGSWVGLGVEISVFVVLATLYLIRGNPRLLKKVALGMIISVFLVTTVGIVWFSVKRIESIRFRLFTWGATMKMISEPIYSSPFKSLAIGQGIETFKLIYPSYRRPEIFHIEGKHNTETDHAHNEFFEILYDEGFLGLIMYLWLLFIIYYAALKRLSMIGMGGARSNDEFYLVAVIAGTAGMIAHSSVSVHVRFVSSGYILWTFLGLLVVQTAPISRKKEEILNPLKGAKYLVIAMLLTVAGLNSFHASRRFIANINHNKAIAYSKQRLWEKALSHYKIVQKYHPSFIMGYYFEGNVYNDKLSEAMNKKNKAEIEENYNKAVETYKKVRSMYPNYVQVHFQEGMLHLKVGETDKAVKSFRKYLNIIDPVYPPTYNRMGMISAQRKEMKTAQWYLEEAPNRITTEKERFRKSKIQAYMSLGEIYIVQKQYKKAEDTYKEALKIEENIGVLNTLARLYEGLKRKKEASDIYKRMLKLQPKNDSIKKKIKSLEF